jgi:hypothetical protein
LCEAQEDKNEDKSEFNGGCMEIKYIEWNLHSMGGVGYEIPCFIADYVKQVDIFVFVEFCISEGWNKLKEDLKDFDLYCSPYVSKGYNQVCIGIRKGINYKLLSVISKDVCDVNIPEFLQLNIEIEDKKLSIIGVRIKTESDTKLLQYNYLKINLQNIENFLCLGDFNGVNNTLCDVFSPVAYVYGPRILNGYHSFVHRNGGVCGLDWLISKGVEDVYNGYPDDKDSPIATYDWSFITEANGYGNKTKYDFLGIKGLPDHAILKGMVKF